MTLTVRLDDTLEAALERYCAATGSSKSLVVQESLAAYLVSRQAQEAAVRPAKGEPSDNFKAFAAAGFIGAGTLPQAQYPDGATNAAVRARVAEHFAQRQARRS